LKEIDYEAITTEMNLVANRFAGPPAALPAVIVFGPTTNRRGAMPTIHFAPTILNFDTQSHPKSF